MNVRELIELLKKEDPERLVVCQRDAEGNGHSLLFDIWDGAWDEHSGDAGLEALTEKDIKEGYGPDDVIKDAVPALFLVPDN